MKTIMMCACLICASCTKAQGQAEVNALPAQVACGVDVATLVLTGSEDPAQLARDCGVTIDQLIAMLAQRPDAPAQRVRAAAIAARDLHRP